MNRLKAVLKLAWYLLWAHVRVEGLVARHPSDWLGAYPCGPNSHLKAYLTVEPRYEDRVRGCLMALQTGAATTDEAEAERRWAALHFDYDGRGAA